MKSLTRSDRRRLVTMARRLEAWFVDSGRRFPWREKGVTLFQHVCVEVLVQRTRAETVAGIYGPFFSRFASWEDLDDATVEELEGILRPVGLWRRRARAMKALAARATELDGKFPATREELRSIPAVGQYVANAILLLGHGAPAPLVDTNMARVLERYLGPRELADIRQDPWLQAVAHYLVRQGDPVGLNWAVLDLGAVTCKPRSPNCDECPLRRGCGRHGI